MARTDDEYGSAGVEQLIAYAPEELDDPTSLIEPLSDDALAALNRLARYKPPPDPYPFPAGRSAVLVALFGSRTGRNLNVLLSTRSAMLRTYLFLTDWTAQLRCREGRWTIQT
ncbi:8-oxo-dGTP diphosphatase [Rhodosporidiobolus nylandii]